MVLAIFITTIEFNVVNSSLMARMISQILWVIKLYAAVASAGEMVLLSYYPDDQHRPGSPVLLKRLKFPCDTRSGEKLINS